MLCLRVSFLKGLLNMYWAELNMLYRVILSPFSFLTCIQKDTLSVFTFAGIKCYLKPLSQLSNTGKKMNLRDKYLWGFWERREKKGFGCSWSMISSLTYLSCDSNQCVARKFCWILFSRKIAFPYGLDLTEAEDIKKTWQEYTEELYKKIFMTQIITMEWSLI